jgi:large subunit ribosomal protein L18
MSIGLRPGKRTAAKAASRLRRQVRGRKRVAGSSQRPRLVVTRSSRHISAQLVDDVARRTLASASTMERELREAAGDKTAKAKLVGESVAQRAQAAGVGAVVFDRAGHRYHGRVAALADGARAAGLEF